MNNGFSGWRRQVASHYFVVGMTVSRSALGPELVTNLKPSLIIVEEAGEVLEGQLVGGLLAAKAGVPAPLVLIGDHEQLQPAVESQPLELEKSLGVSLFERSTTCKKSRERE